MAARVNTKFVIWLSAALVLLTCGAVGVWFVVQEDPATLIAEGEVFMSQGEYELAIESYGKALKERPTDVALMQKTRDALLADPVEDVVEARKRLGQIINVTRMMPEARAGDDTLLRPLLELYQDLAQNLGTGYYAQLAEAADLRLRNDPNNVVARKYRGIAWVNQLSKDLTREQIAQPREDLELVLEQNPGDAEVAYHLARWKLFEADRIAEQGELASITRQVQELRAEAIELSREQLADDPDDQQRMIHHADILMREVSRLRREASRREQQLEQLERFIEREGSSQRALSQQASWREELAGYQKTYEPLLAEAGGIVDRLEARLLEKPEPAADLIEVVELLPRVDREKVPDELAPAGTLSRGLVRAERLLSSAMEKQPENIMIRFAHGRALNMMGRRDAALRAFEVAREIGSTGSAVQALRGTAIKARAAVEAGGIMLQLAEDAGPGEERDRYMQGVEDIIEEVTVLLTAPNAETNLLAGKLAMARGQINEAMIKLDRASEQFGNANVEALLFSARARRLAKQYGAAAERLERLIEARPELMALRVELARVYIEGRQYDRAQEQVDLMLTANPESSQALGLQAMIYAGQENFEKALELTQQFDSSRRPEALVSMAQLTARAGRTDEALVMLRQRLAEQPADLAALRLAVQLTEDRGQQAAMIASARQAGASENALSLLEAAIDPSKGNADEVVAQLIENETDPYARSLARARLARQRSDLAAASAALDEAERLQPDSPEVLQLRFELAIASENWPEAERLAERAGTLNLDLAQGYFFRGNVAAAKGELSRAVAAYRQGLSARPVFSGGWHRLGVVLGKSRDWPAAADAFQRAIQQRPDNVAAIRGLAGVFAAQGQTTRALEQLRQAYRYAPNDPELRDQYLAFEQQYGDKQIALLERQELAESQPGNLANRRMVAMLLAEVGDTEAALAEARALIEQDGRTRGNVATLASVQRQADRAEAGEETIAAYVRSLGQDAQTNDWVLLARYRLESGDGAGAVEAYNRARAIEDPETRPASRELADLYFNRGAAAQAAEIYAELFRENPGDQGLGLRLAESLLRTDRIEQAQQVIAKLEESATVRLLQGTIARRQDRVDEAMQRFDQALELDPRNAMARLQRAAILAGPRQQPEAALAELRRAVELAPDLTAARLAMAEVLADQGRTGEAIGTLRTLIENEPDQVQARVRLLNLLLTSGDLVSAQAVADDSAQRWPEQAQWARLQASIAERRGETARAIGHWRQAVELEPEARNIMSLVLALIEDGQPAAALGVLDEYPEEVGQEPLLQAARGRALMERRQPEVGRRVFARALERARSYAQVAEVARQIKAAAGPEEAITLLEAATPASANPAWIELALAQTEIEAGQYSPSIQRIESVARTLGSDDTELQRQVDQMRALAYYETGQYEESGQAYARLLKDQPNNVATMNNYAFLLADKLGQAEEALPLAERAASLAPKNPKVLDTLGLVQLTLGRYDDARRNLEQSLSLERFAANQLHLARVYLQSGSRVRAIDLLRQAARQAELEGETEIKSQAEALLAEHAG